MNAGAWHPDPAGRHELRFWDGAQWTEHVSDDGIHSVSPLTPPEAPTAESRAAQAETPAAEVSAPEAAATPAAGDPVAAAPAPYSSMSGISGDLVDGGFAEKQQGTGPSLQNGKLLRVRIAEPFMARQGSMVAYQGQVTFVYQGGGAGKFLKKALTGEGLSLMRVEGAGDVFLANAAEHVHILHLNNSGISINGAHVLAFSAGLDWNVERVKGGSIAAGGLFNTTLRGTGWVAVTTDGEPVVLNAAEAPTFADTDAIVAWSIELQTSINKRARR
jgi:uncharacterized protein (AIM24 family)